MSLKIYPLLRAALIVSILILSFMIFRGCKQSKIQVAENNTLKSLNQDLLETLRSDKLLSDSSKKEYQDSLSFSNGQLALVKEQKIRTEIEIQDITKENKALIKRYKLGDYTDTATTLVPNDFISDCQGCFVNLEKTTGLVERYKNDINNIQNNWDKQTQLYQKRFKELDAEKLGFYNKINTLAKEQQKVIDQLKPHGRLYVTWGVLWKPLPWAAGAGAMFQTKRNLIIGATWYYSSQGSLIETNIHFPLSLKFR